jgi:tripartite-type tricarboxylate transporter receptor subunit TctC
MSISSQVSRFGLVAAAVLALGLGPAAAQDYPSSAIDFIVPFNPGGGADASQRTFNKFAEPIVGQPLVIVNKPGAGGTMGWAELVRAEPDGYTLAIVTPPFNVIPPLARPQQTGYTLDQFTYICVYAVVPDVRGQ